MRRQASYPDLTPPFRSMPLLPVVLNSGSTSDQGQVDAVSSIVLRVPAAAAPFS